VAASDPGTGDWPMWGGTPDRNMVSSMKGLPTEWDVAAKKNVKTLTFCLPLNQARAIRQAKAWGFEEFRIMAEPTKMLAFFRKSIE